jgi:hypothetical protein
VAQALGPALPVTRHQNARGFPPRGRDPAFTRHPPLRGGWANVTGTVVVFLYFEDELSAESQTAATMAACSSTLAAPPGRRASPTRLL